MNRTTLFIVFLIIGICNIGCTDDEVVEASLHKMEASIYHKEAFISESGEEGDQDLDDQRD